MNDTRSNQGLSISRCKNCQEIGRFRLAQDDDGDEWHVVYGADGLEWCGRVQTFNTRRGRRDGSPGSYTWRPHDDFYANDRWRGGEPTWGE